jgi:hypothetical protein
MIAFNASIDYFRYTDPKLLLIMVVGRLVFVRPETIYIVV